MDQTISPRYCVRVVERCSRGRFAAIPTVSPRDQPVTLNRSAPGVGIGVGLPGPLFWQFALG
jgi:hypothetical protein